MIIRQFGLLIAMLSSGLGFAQPELRYNAKLDVTTQALDFEAPIPIDFSIEGVEDGACLYIPAHDQKLRQALLLEAIKASSPQETAGRTELNLEWTEKDGLEHVGPALYRINRPKDKSLHLKYLLTLSGWKDRDQAPRLLNLWHPIYLKNCPSASEQVFASIWPKAVFQVDFKPPAPWQLAAPGVTKGDRHIYEGTSFAAAIYQKRKQFTYDLGGQTLITLSKSPSFEALIGVAKAAMHRYRRLTGLVPEQTVLLVETDDFEPLRSPGLVTLNTPQQAGMRYLQQELTHWFVWQISLHMAQQWFGLQCKAATVDDYWLMQGLADILAYSLVSSEKDYFEFFGPTRSGKPLLNLNYRQAQDIAAASLSLLHPHSSLLDENGRSREATQDRPFISYVRGSQILRYLQWKLGKREFESFLQEAMFYCSEEGLSPARLAEIADHHKKGAGRLMLQYWGSDDWPDIALNGTYVKDGVTYLRISYANELLLPIDVWVTTKDDVRRVFFLEPLTQEFDVALDEKEEDIKKIEINPGRALFDKDRFNNKTGAPRLQFFPGAARGLDDDAYTVVWLPYVSQLPGEPFTINLAYQTLRYLNSGITGIVRHQPSENRTGFNLYYLKSIPEYSLFLLGRVGQDDGHVEDGERRITLDVKRKPVLSLWPRLSFAGRLKSKQMLGQPDSRHITTGLNLTYSSESGRACSHEEEIETETTVYVPSQDFRYSRNLGRLSAGCESKQIGGRFRLFYGASKADGSIPRTALFRAQNLDEAHIRLDKPHLKGALRILSLNTEVAIPAKLPLPESWFVLPRRSQFKAFYDAAEIKDPDQRVEVAGVGYTLPIGGDIAGKESLTFIRFALNGVLYRKIDGVIHDKPGILFDFGGNL